MIQGVASLERRYERFMNDLQIQITEQGKITTNLETLKKELTEIAERYNGVVVQEDSVSVAKKDLAELRKLKTEIDDRRKSVKKEWAKPYDAFEKEVKAALAIIEKPIGEIDSQIKAFEKAEKEQKEKRCRKIYDENVPDDLKEYVPYERAYSDKWLNKSTKENEIIADLSMAYTQVRIDIDSIKALESEIEEECLKAYKMAGNQLAAAIKRNQDYINAKAAAEARIKEEAEQKAREEAERKAREEAEKAEAEKQAAEQEKKEPVDDFMNPPVEEIPFFTEEVVDFRVFGQENIEKVRQFLTFSEIDYKEV